MIIKIGGGQSINIEGIAQDLTNHPGSIIVHGANALRDELLEKLDIEKHVVTSIKGYSSVVTDDDMIDAIKMAYAGLQNKTIVELCQRNGINAIGLSGIDGGLIRSERNRGIKIEENGRKRIIRDRSGKPRTINTALLTLLLENGYTPVLCIPTLDENGYATNSENDDIVTLIHHEVRAERIIQLIEAPGYLEDPRDDTSVRKTMTRTDLERELETSSGRMKRKLHALHKLLETPTTIHISDGRIERPISTALEGAGTVIR